MRDLMTRRTTRMLAVSALVLVTAGATLGGAQAASARTPMINGDCAPVIFGLFMTGGQVEAIHDQACTQPDGETIINDWPVSLSRLVNGSWVLLGTGDGAVGHECVGTTKYEYSGAGSAVFACG